jgi:SAM-dependent methyltransferase
LHFLQSVTRISPRTHLIAFGPPSLLHRRCVALMPMTRLVTQLAIDEGSYRLRAPTGEADVVIAAEVLHTIPPLDEALAEIRRVLGPGGQFVFTVPFRLFSQATESRLDDLPRSGGHLPVECGHHVHEIGWDLIDRLRAAGFRRPTAHCYRSEELGYLGLFDMIFSADA